MDNLERLIRDVPDFPKKGIVFKDITPLLKDADGFRHAIDTISDHFSDKNIEVVASAEARGFIIGPCVALNLNAGFVPIRKPGKLPFKTRSITYDLEYGKDTLEIHTDALHNHQNVLLVDDLLATGGTMAACCKLIETLGCDIIGCAFLIELCFLNGRRLLDKYDTFSVIKYM